MTGGTSRGCRCRQLRTVRSSAGGRDGASSGQGTRDANCPVPAAPGFSRPVGRDDSDVGGSRCWVMKSKVRSCPGAATNRHRPLPRDARRPSCRVQLPISSASARMSFFVAQQGNLSRAASIFMCRALMASNRPARRRSWVRTPRWAREPTRMCSARRRRSAPARGARPSR